MVNPQIYSYSRIQAEQLHGSDTDAGADSP